MKKQLIISSIIGIILLFSIISVSACTPTGPCQDGTYSCLCGQNNHNTANGGFCLNNGDCQGSSVCTNQVCVASCQPNCNGKECGGDGCGNYCGQCDSGYSCSGGNCVSNCQPSCSGNCGSDGCGGSCGTCSGTQTCNNGNCVSSCTDTCQSLGFNCGNELICGNTITCGTCSNGQSCNNGVCSSTPPTCTDGATQPCTLNGLNGTQSCSNNAWSDCNTNQPINWWIISIVIIVIVGLVGLLVFVYIKTTKGKKRR